MITTNTIVNARGATRRMPFAMALAAENWMTHNITTNTKHMTSAQTMDSIHSVEKTDARIPLATAIMTRQGKTQKKSVTLANGIPPNKNGSATIGSTATKIPSERDAFFLR